MEKLADLFELFCDFKYTISGNTPRTIKWYREVFRLFLKHTDLEYPHQLTRISFEKWIAYGKIELKWSNRTIRSRITVFRLFLDWSVQREFHPHNFARDLALPRIQHKLRPHLSRETALSLMEGTLLCPFNTRFERYRAMAIIATFLFTGIRKTELLKMEIKDIKFEQTMIQVRYGKGEKQRIIPLHPRLETILREYLQERKKKGYTTEALIVSSSNDRHLSERAFRRLMIKIRDNTEIEFSAHILRHSFAVLMIEGGANFYSLSKLLGHSDPKTTTIYLKSTPTMLKSDMECFPL